MDPAYAGSQGLTPNFCLGRSCMAIYSLNLGFISRSEGRSAVGFSAYISASRQQDIRTGVGYDYGCKEDVVVSRVLVPEGAPDWARNPSLLWNKVEQFEDEI